MRKVSAALSALFVMAATLVVLALPAGAGVNFPSYPPEPTQPTQPASQEASKLAFTGSNSTPLLLIGLVAVVLGAVLVVAARRRRSVASNISS